MSDHPQGPPRGPSDPSGADGPNGPPAGPTGGPYPPPPHTERRDQRPAWLPYVVGGVAVALLVGVFAVAKGGGDSAGAPTTSDSVPTEIFLEAAASPGVDPYTPDVEQNVVPVTAPAALPTTTPATAALPATTSAPTTTPPGTTLARRVPVRGVNALSGNTPGLYGGTRNNSSCNGEQMISFLSANPDKAAAWAGVIGISISEIPTYIRSLTPVILRYDTRVTNHGFKYGRATSNQSVLQAGTAVLVDVYGVPRARCKCGNPLSEPWEAPQVYRGDPWSWWNPIDVVIYRPAPVRIDIFILISITTGEAFGRPPGTTGTGDIDPPPGTYINVVTPDDLATTTTTAITTTTATTTTTAETTTSMTSTTSTTVAPTTQPPASVDITGLGTISSSSDSPGFGAELAVDGNFATSWFSDGRGGNDPFADSELFGWSVGTGVQIDSVVIQGNGENPKYSHGYGFASITVEVYDENNGVVFSGTVPYPQTGSVGVTPRVRGVGIDIILNGHESPDCGGFGELIVSGYQL